MYLPGLLSLWLVVFVVVVFAVVIFEVVVFVLDTPSRVYIDYHFLQQR